MSILFILFYSLMKNLTLGKDFPSATDYLEKTSLCVHFLLESVCSPCMPCGVSYKNLFLVKGASEGLPVR